MGRRVEPPRTHCQRGHRLTPENVIEGIVGKGRPHRACRACQNAARRRYARRMRKGERHEG